MTTATIAKMSDPYANLKSLLKKGQLMPKPRMTADEKDFYNKMLKAFKLGVKPSELPGPVLNKWARLHTTKTF